MKIFIYSLSKHVCYAYIAYTVAFFLAHLGGGGGSGARKKTAERSQVNQSVFQQKGIERIQIQMD